MHLSKYIISGVRTAERMRQRIAGPCYFSGHRLWTAKENKILRSTYPDYSAALEQLPGRSLYAIRTHVRELGIQRRNHIWTGAEIVRLRKLFPTATWPELQAAFPGLTRNAIKVSARHRGLARARRRFKPTGDWLLDEVRTRCFALGYTMLDLDILARTKSYFRNRSWTHRRADRARLCKAVEALGGTLSVAWQD